MREPIKNLLVASVAGLLLAACGSDTEETASATERETDGGFSKTTILKERYDVEYADGVAVVEDDTMAKLVSYDADTSTLIFAGDAREDLRFDTGQVVVFSRLTLGRVKSVLESGSNIVVETTPAAFTDAYRNADIELEARVEWAQPQTSNVLPRFELIRSAMADESWSIGHKFSYKGVEVDVKFIPKSADRLEFEINSKISKSAKMQAFTRAEAAGVSTVKEVTPDNWAVSTMDLLDLDSTPEYSSGLPEPDTGDRTHTVTPSGAVAAVKASGHISGFVQALQINVRESSLEKFDFRLRELKGEMRVEGAGLTDAAGSFEVKMPLEYVIPVYVGPVPVAIKVGAALKLTPQVHSGSSKFCFKASYDASTGLSFETGSLKNESDVKSRKAELCGREETVSAGPITVGFGASANFPEISLLIFGNTIVPSIALQTGGATTYEPGLLSALPACQSGKVDLQALIKVALSFLGVLMEREHKLWQRKKEWKCDGTVEETTFDPVNGEKKETRRADE